MYGPDLSGLPALFALAGIGVAAIVTAIIVGLVWLFLHIQIV
jgi:hypothetical protein